ncbi:Hypothetical predicted protein, partial [Paramuricea clavata]
SHFPHTGKTGLSKRTFLRTWKSFQKPRPTDTGKTELSKRTFLTARKTFQKSRPTGSSELDIVFVLDKSGSIGPSNFVLEKTFVQNLIEFFPISPAKTRVAVVTYSSWLKLEFNFNKHINNTCLRNGIQKIGYTGGFTSTGSALEYVKNNLLFSPAAGARSEAMKVIYLLTDGKSNRGVKPGIPAGQLKQRQVIIYAMGVTTHIRESELQQIASSKPEDHVFHVMNYAVLNEVTRLLQGDLPKKKSIQDTTVFARRRTG